MRAERPPCGAVGLSLVLALLSSGCASLPSRTGPGATLTAVSGATPLVAVGRGTVASLPEDEALEDFDEEPAGGPLLHRRRATPSPPSPGGGETAPLRVVGALAGVCGEVPPGWPHLPAEDAVLAPFLACTTPAAFLALQRQADMPRLVEALADWNAVRLGALGPLEAEAARVLLKKRAAFLAAAVERHGLAKAEVLALFVLHTAHDDEVRQLLRLLAEDRLLTRALGAMEVVREELMRRGMALADFPERSFRGGDIARGLGRAADDVAASIPLVGGSRSIDASALPSQLPPPYRAAYEEVEKARYLGAFAPGNVALASFDSLTFGVPLGFYHLAAGTAQGGASLAKGEYEEATRQLAPAALMVGLYAGGKGARSLREAGVPRLERARLQAVVPRVEALKAVLERVEARIGESAVGELARLVRQSREAALLVAEWGDAAALALYESRGNVPKARQAMLAVASSDQAKPASTRARDTSLPGRADVGAKVDAKDIKGARPYGPDGRPGHPDAHGVSRHDQANIINDPASTLHRGTNANNRPVDHYHRDGTTVVTEQGDPTRVITAFGTLATKDGRGRPISRGTGKPASPLPKGGPYEKLR
ncbi:hypothetical protein [Corallococcus macrosporus]|uniref:Lipoprotein n=1 Tax=Myxococcus fulvus (strain ATCC BAA-855 / HW-1) TaxID=483219 RepID=F8CR36_MYXFH|nr:hypothetical protein [Corallococcus macrosporus]AEI63080.1 hypothetical protein LILAB_05795 [Corallococcus macrosporus]